MKKLLLSVLTIGLVASVAFGATRAFFSDTATSTGNTFSAGTMEFRIARPGETNHRVFNVSNLKPGQVVSGYLVVVNDSTAGLDMKWKAWVSGWDSGILDNVLEVKITGRPTDYAPALNPKYTIAGPFGGYPVTRWSDGTPRWISIHDLGSGNTILAWNYDCDAPSPDEPFRVDWAGVYKIEVRMQESAGNYYQNTSFTGDLNFYATQCENNLY